MLPRLKAEEQIDLFNVMLAASGRVMDDNQHRMLVQELQTRALGKRPPVPVGSVADIEATGIRVRKEPARDDEEAKLLRAAAQEVRDKAAAAGKQPRKEV
jgi:hypothetical protein